MTRPTVSLGCDPEINVFCKKSKGYLRYPFALHERLGRMAVDSYTWLNKLSDKKLGYFGVDGGGLEFHPGPSYSPRRVVHRLYEMMHRVKESKLFTENCHFVAGSFGAGPSGGHIHLGGQATLVGHAGEEKHDKARRAVLLSMAVLKILEDPMQAGKRGNGQGYGATMGTRGARVMAPPDYYANDSRSREEWESNYKRAIEMTKKMPKDFCEGGHVTFEIRSPSTDWTSHPVLAEAALSLAQGVGHVRYDIADEVISYFKSVDTIEHRDLGGLRPHATLTPQQEWLLGFLRQSFPREIDTIVHFADLHKAEREENAKAGLLRTVFTKLDAEPEWYTNLTRRGDRGTIVEEVA